MDPKLIKVGLIGYGAWGKILARKLQMFCDVKFTCRSKDTYIDKLDDVDWVVVSTPNDTHYEIVRKVTHLVAVLGLYPK